MQWTGLRPKLLKLHGRSTSGTESVHRPDNGTADTGPCNPQTPESLWSGGIRSSLPGLQERKDGECPAH